MPTPAAVPAAALPPIVGSPIAADALGAPLKNVSENGSGSSARPLKARRRFSPSRGDASAARALRQVGDESLALLPAEAAVGLLREGELGAVARDQVLELLGERAAGTEDQRLERGLRDVEDRRDLLVRASLHLPEDECFALRLRDSLQRTDEILDRRDVVVGLERGKVAVELDLARAGLLLAETLPNEVVRDRDQPVRRLARLLASLERAQRIDERRLGDVLGVGPVAEDGIDVAVDLRCVGAVELVQIAVGLDPDCC